MAKTTIKQLFELSLALLFEKPGEDEDYKTAFPYLLTKTMMQVLPYENMVRQSEGRELLKPEDLPFVTEITEETLPFDERFVRTAMPDGLAGLFMTDDDGKKAEAVMQYNKFVGQCQEIAPAVFVELLDTEEEDA